MIEDSRVSRSHARVEYTDTRTPASRYHCTIVICAVFLTVMLCYATSIECEYIDLGSSCGSKLNGKPVLRAKLQPGTPITLRCMCFMMYHGDDVCDRHR